MRSRICWLKCYRTSFMLFNFRIKFIEIETVKTQSKSAQLICYFSIHVFKLNNKNKYYFLSSRCVCSIFIGDDARMNLHIDNSVFFHRSTINVKRYLASPSFDLFFLSIFALIFLANFSAFFVWKWYFIASLVTKRLIRD